MEKTAENFNEVIDFFKESNRQIKERLSLLEKQMIVENSPPRKRLWTPSWKFEFLRQDILKMEQKKIIYSLRKNAKDQSSYQFNKILKKEEQEKREKEKEEILKNRQKAGNIDQQEDNKIKTIK